MKPQDLFDRLAAGYEYDPMYGALCNERDQLKAENSKLRELVRGLHMAYVGALNECESLDEGLIWEYSGSIDADVAKSKARFEADRHRFDVAMSELGIEVEDA